MPYDPTFKFNTLTPYYLGFAVVQPFQPQGTVAPDPSVNERIQAEGDEVAHAFPRVHGVPTLVQP